MQEVGSGEKKVPTKFNVWFLIWIVHTFNNHNQSIMVMQSKPLRIPNASLRLYLIRWLLKEEGIQWKSLSSFPHQYQTLLCVTSQGLLTEPSLCVQYAWMALLRATIYTKGVGKAPGTGLCSWRSAYHSGTESWNESSQHRSRQWQSFNSIYRELMVEHNQFIVLFKVLHLEC